VGRPGYDFQEGQDAIAAAKAVIAALAEKNFGLIWDTLRK
jgi:hypothetical protein